MDALADGLDYSVTMYDRKLRHHRQVNVRAGEGCSRVMKAIRKDRPGGLGVVAEVDTERQPTPAALAGQFPGAARWQSQLRRPTDVAQDGGGWEGRVATGRFRPSAEVLLRAYADHHSCGADAPGSNPPCADELCPACWNDACTFSTALSCSRYKHGAPLKASSGLGRWKGGDVRSAGPDGECDAWVLGDGGGEDVEVWKGSPASGEGPVDPQQLTLGRIIYFFEHEGNNRLGGGQRPTSSWVLLFDYATSGQGNARLADAATKHPILALRGRGNPLVYPAHAIRRHVHMYHLCPSPPDSDARGSTEADDEEHRITCGVVHDTRKGFGGGLVWRHKYNLATAGAGGDRYLLNEHHHSIYRESFV